MPLITVEWRHPFCSFYWQHKPDGSEDWTDASGLSGYVGGQGTDEIEIDSITEAEIGVIQCILSTPTGETTLTREARLDLALEFIDHPEDLTISVVGGSVYQRQGSEDWMTTDFRNPQDEGPWEIAMEFYLLRSASTGLTLISHGSGGGTGTNWWRVEIIDLLIRLRPSANGAWGDLRSTNELNPDEWNTLRAGWNTTDGAYIELNGTTTTDPAMDYAPESNGQRVRLWNNWDIDNICQIRNLYLKHGNQADPWESFYPCNEGEGTVSIDTLGDFNAIIVEEIHADPL